MNGQNPEGNPLTMIGLEKVRPDEIERRSFEIISGELGDRKFDRYQEPVVKRVIHTTADFEYADSLVFSENAAPLAIEALKKGADIVTDTNMGKAGINKKTLGKLGGKIHCFMAEEDVAAEAKKRGVTRAAVSMERAALAAPEAIFAIGNAPTALIRLSELVGEGEIRPALVIGAPVGFVNVVQAKELALTLDVPFIVARGRKGGSNVAAAVCNALIYQAQEELEALNRKN